MYEKTRIWPIEHSRQELKNDHHFCPFLGTLVHFTAVGTKTHPVRLERYSHSVISHRQTTNVCEISQNTWDTDFGPQHAIKCCLILPLGLVWLVVNHGRLEALGSDCEDGAKIARRLVPACHSKNTLTHSPACSMLWLTNEEDFFFYVMEETSRWDVKMLPLDRGPGWTP